MAAKIYDGSAWNAVKALKIYNGSSWANAIKGWVFDGSNWRQYYPDLPSLITAPTGTWPGNYNGFGESRAGAQVTMTSGTWSNNPTSYTYEFFAAPYSNGNAWSTVQSASSTNTWTATNSYAGYYIKCRVTAINARGSTSTDVTLASLLNPPGISSATLSYNSSAKTATISWSPPNGWTGSYQIWYQYGSIVPYSVFHQSGTSFTFNYGPYQSQGLTLMGISVGTAIVLPGWPNTGNWYDGYVYQTTWYFP